MKLSTDAEYRNFWFELLKTDDIQKGYKQVFDIFCASRNAGNDPQAILQMQVDACRHIFTLEQLKTVLNKSGEEHLATFFGHMRSVVKHIIDSLAWRASRCHPDCWLFRTFRALSTIVQNFFVGHWLSKRVKKR